MYNTYMMMMMMMMMQVVDELPCWGLYALQEGQVAVVWAYAYQGLENKVVVYLPGDTPWRPDTRGREIPAPGLCSTPRQEPRVWEPTTARHLKESGPPPSNPEPSCTTTTNNNNNGGEEERDLNGSQLKGVEVDGGGGEGTGGGGGGGGAVGLPVGVSAGVGEGSGSGSGSGEFGSRLRHRPRSEGAGVNLPDYWWKVEDVQRYSNWDKSNLFVAGSRCLSQLIMLIP